MSDGFVAVDGLHAVHYYSCFYELRAGSTRRATPSLDAGCCTATTPFYAHLAPKYAIRGKENLEQMLHDDASTGTGIMVGFQVAESTIMEAEHINSISNKLDDLAQRAAELRRYL
ncbi:MAG: hypothetical protein Q8S26_03630 [Azonexus sp.]|nr:hypothetical protein [Azonexus sp.]